jgi:hypothetical protein
MDDMKQRLSLMMGDEFKDIKYAIFPKTIEYK